MEKQEHKEYSRRPLWPLLLFCIVTVVCSGIISATVTMQVMASMRIDFEQASSETAHNDSQVNGRFRRDNEDPEPEQTDETEKSETEETDTTTTETRPTPSDQVGESIHVVGDGSKPTIADLQRSGYVITKWNKTAAKINKQGNIKYLDNEGSIQVARKGYYFVYSQMYYCEPGMSNHKTKINNADKMESIITVGDNATDSKDNTAYHGGMFLLQKGDKITVSATQTKCYSMNETRSFFGAFLISPVL